MQTLTETFIDGCLKGYQAPMIDRNDNIFAMLWAEITLNSHAAPPN
jgi:hypothetical protein